MDFFELRDRVAGEAAFLCGALGIRPAGLSIDARADDDGSIRVTISAARYGFDALVTGTISEPDAEPLEVEGLIYAAIQSRAAVNAMEAVVRGELRVESNA